MVPTTSALIPALIAHTPKASAGSRFAGLPPTSLIGTPGASLEGVGSSAGSSKPVPEIARFPPLPRWNRARPPRTSSFGSSYLPSTPVAFDGLGLIFANLSENERTCRCRGSQAPRLMNLIGFIRNMVEDRVRQTTDRRRKKLPIESAIGPTPWYWRTFSEPEGFRWRFLERKGGSVTVLEPHAGGDPVLALGMYVYAFPTNRGYFGLWSRSGRERPFI